MCGDAIRVVEYRALHRRLLPDLPDRRQGPGRQHDESFPAVIALAGLRAVIDEAERLLGHSILEDCVDPDTGELFKLTVVTDNGPCYKSTDFAKAFMGRPELRHVRTRHYAPQTNGVVERFNQSLKYEHLYRHEITDGQDLAEHIETFRDQFNRLRPHEALGFDRPLDRYLATPPSYALSEPKSVPD